MMMKNLQISGDEAKFLLELLNQVQGQRQIFRRMVEPLALKVEALLGVPEDAEPSDGIG